MAADPPPAELSAELDQLNLKQAAARLDVHYMTAYRYVRQGRLAATRAGTEWRVTESAITEFLRRRDHRAATDSTGVVDWADRLGTCLLAGDEPAARGTVDAALASGHPVEFCYVEMLAAALASVGARGHAGEISIADQHIATAVASRVVAHLGVLARRPGRSRGTIVFGAPTGELHSLPISIAADLVRLAGFDVLELGANVPHDAFALAATRASRLVAIGIGVTGSEHLPAAQAAIDAVRHTDPDVPIVIGGQAAITTASAGLTGVTAWAATGPDAVTLIESLARTSPRGASRTRGRPPGDAS
jgi:excisionase family DNA binding protein